MAAVTVFCKQESPRFRYVLNWVLRDVLHITYQLTDDESEVVGMPFFISYGRAFTNALSIPDSGLIWEEAIKEQSIETGVWKTIPTLFQDEESQMTLPFDFFGAVFYLISRYEEYHPEQLDKHERYLHTNSMLFKNGWLQRPLIDEWIYELYLILQANNIPAQLSPFHYRPTYDIDMAYSYKHKGVRRNIGGFIRDFLKGDIAAVKERKDVLLSNKLDPFDAFVWMKQLHSENRVKPIYFILASLETTEYDKNISPESEAMQKLIARLSKDGQIGMHPSYYSYKEEIFDDEQHILQQIVGYPINHSRQHYIKMAIPDTYRRLIKKHIRHDYSMGYGTALGFRAATGRSFYWYDVEKEEQTELRVYPFCFMDSTVLFNEDYSPEKAFAELKKMTKIARHTHSSLITVFHNFSLGNVKSWRAWRDKYELFVREASKN